MESDEAKYRIWLRSAFMSMCLSQLMNVSSACRFWVYDVAHLDLMVINVRFLRSMV
jgi:hypothetical protein